MSRFRQVVMEYLMRAREALKDGHTPVIRKEASAATTIVFYTSAVCPFARLFI